MTKQVPSQMQLNPPLPSPAPYTKLCPSLCHGDLGTAGTATEAGQGLPQPAQGGILQHWPQQSSWSPGHNN